MSSDLEIPSDLLTRPLALIGLTGLEVETNSTHLAVWNSFSSLSSGPNSNSNSHSRGGDQRPPLNFVLFPGDHSFIPAKPDRASYEWYIPKGILKRSWANKHLHLIPGVLVLFADLEWDDPNWKAKHAEFSARLHALRTGLSGRGTKLVLVLLQGSAPLPSSEDVLAAERAASLCQACELSPKSLFVLPCRSDHLQGYTLRLEAAFYELAQSSYHLSSRAVRSHRDQLNRTNHKYLYVRHQFKMGFYHELKQDVAMAHKHYSQAYAHLLELRITDANVTEVKIVAGYLGYKVWRLSFLLNLPREAIAHFRSHVDFFRLRLGHPLGRFEHHSWLSNQFSTFGRLFEDAIELGLPAIQTQHPGFYYQQAALQAVARKRAVLQDSAGLSPEDLAAASTVIIENEATLEFYGQRPWRPSRLSLEPADMKAENEGMAGLLLREKLHVDLTGHIVGALTAAVNQFKNHRSPRMKQYLLVQMAEEYSKSGNYSEALTLLEPLLWDYRKDFWWVPLTSLLQLGLRCAYLSARIPDYFAFAIELCSASTVNDRAQKVRLLANLEGILRKRVPPPEDDIEPAAITESCADRKWREQLDAMASVGRTCVTTVVTNQIASFFRIRATFVRKQFAAEEPILLEAHIRYTGPETVQLTGISVALNNAAYLPHCQIQHPDKAEELLFQPGQIRCYSFQFPAEAQDVGGELQISSVTLEMGRDMVAYLRCEGAASDELDGPSASRMIEFPTFGTTVAPMDLLAVFNVTEILPRTARVALKVEHDCPALRGECYPLVVHLTNEEDDSILDVQVVVTSTPYTVEESGVAVELMRLTCWPESMDQSSDPFSVTLTRDRIGTEDRVSTWKILARLPVDRIGSHLITLQVNYRIDNGAVVSKSQYVTSVELESVEPIVWDSQYQTLQFQSLDPPDQLPAGESCLAVVSVTNISPFPLLLDSGSFQLETDFGGPVANPVSKTEILSTSPLSGLILQPGEKASDLAVLQLADADSQAAMKKIFPGSYSLQWKRTAFSKTFDNDELGEGLPLTSIRYNLPAAHIRAGPGLHISVKLPAHGHVRQAMNASVILRNSGHSCIELDVAMSSNDAFMFAGNKQVRIQIYPGDDHTLMYNLYPLLSGFVALPPIQLRPSTLIDPSDGELQSPLDADILDELVARYVPTHIYVLPQAKEKSASNNKPVAPTALGMTRTAT